MKNFLNRNFVNVYSDTQDIRYQTAYTHTLKANNIFQIGFASTSSMWHSVAFILYLKASGNVVSEVCMLTTTMGGLKNQYNSRASAKRSHSFGRMAAIGKINVLCVL